MPHQITFQRFRGVIFILLPFLQSRPSGSEFVKHRMTGVNIIKSELNVVTASIQLLTTTGVTVSPQPCFCLKT